MDNEESKAVNTEVVEQETTPTEPASEETKEPVVEEAPKEDATEETDNPETEDKSKDEPEAPAEETDKPRGGAEDRKQQLNSEIRELVAQRNTLKKEIEQKNSEAYRVATEDELLDQVNPETGQYFNRIEAKLAVMEQNDQLRRYNEEVAEAQLTLSAEAQRALQDFPMFDETSSEYDAEIAKEVDQLLGANLVFDQNTRQVIGSHVSPYKLYKAVARSAKQSALNGQIKGQKATEQMLSSADNTGSAPQREQSFDKLSAAEMASKLRLKGYDI